MPFKTQNFCHITPKLTDFDIQEKPLNIKLRGFVSKTNVFNFKDFIYFLFVCIITDKIIVKVNISIVVKIIILLL